MLDTHRDTLRHLVAAYQRARSSKEPQPARQTAWPYRELFVEPLLAMLGWRAPPQHGDLTLAPWPASAGAPPAYLCTYQDIRRFMLATAAPGLDIDTDARPAVQLRRRAWSANLAVAVLTNVETIAVYDTRIRPTAQDAPHVGRRLHIPWDEITQRWDELAQVLSKGAVQAGAFDAFAYAKAQRCVSVKQAFVADTQRWCGLLGGAARDAQAVLGGAIFLVLAQARGLAGSALGPRILEAADARLALMQALAEATKPWGCLDMPVSQAALLAVHEPGLRTVIAQLCNPTAYDLAWLPDDILGHTYEASLARRAALPNQVALPTAPQTTSRKSTGVYYTPWPVVRHIVRHVIRRLLQSHPPAALVASDNETLRILDPACGAGAFLVEVYRALCHAILAYYLSFDPLENPRLVAVAPGVWRLGFAEKCRILQAHVFGVDIDPQAVVVTQRALWLMALSGEPMDAAASAAWVTPGHGRGLPCLDDNIKCGNMLIAPDFGADDAQLTQAQSVAARPFDWRVAFAAVAHAGGFDAVVGNPPYGVVFSAAQRAYLKRRFVHQGYRADSYLLFIELCLRELVRPNGFCGLIVPNPWLTNLKQQPLRLFVLQNAVVEKIVHFGCAMFKAQAVVDTQIVLLRRQMPQQNHVHTHRVNACAANGHIDLASATTVLHKQAAWVAQADVPINIFVDDARRALAAKIKARGEPVSTRLRGSVGMKPYQVGKGRPKQTADMVQARVYDADVPQGVPYRSYLRGADMQRFIVAPVRPRYIRYGPWLAEPRIAANFDAPAKLVLRQTSDHLVAAIDDQKRICMNNMHVLTPREATCPLEGFMGVFNSRLMNWYYQILNPERGEALAEVKLHHVENLPIPNDPAALAGIGDTAREVARLTASLQKAAPNADASMHDTQAHHAALTRLDQQVFALYALNDQDVALINADEVD